MVRTVFHALGGYLALLFLLRLVVGTWIERRWPAYRVSLRRVFLGDLVTTLFLAFVTFPAAGWVAGHLRLASLLPQITWSLPLRFLAYLVLVDLGHYWIHRLMHLPLFWRIHKWHHAPEHMGWLAGNRESFLDRLLVSIPYTLLWPLVGLSPGWLLLGLTAFSQVKNDWMHLNVDWRTGWLEGVLVTPRYHHVHHSTDPAHYTSNLAPLFSFWDRLFGTYQDPAQTAGKLSFGIGERVPLPRLMTGL
ncbi:MAG TPA: sterol desaturase family protein [Polyangia bacterium]|nr:sterol desaturase family protein [Polyangia bacterium]